MEKAEKGILGFVVAGIIISIVIAMFVSPFASSFPDGLEKVAEKLGFIDRSTSAIGENFFLIPDYSFGYVKSELWQGSIAGLFGVLIVLVIFGIVYLIYKAVNRKRKTRSVEAR